MPFKNQGFTVIVFLSLIFVFNCCTQKLKKFETRKIRIIATTTLVADMVKNIGGDKVEVISLMGAGIDPHLYKASENDIIRIIESDIIIYSGLHLEGKMQSVFRKMEKGKFNTMAVTDGIAQNELIRVDENNKEYDPHFWFSIRLWKEASTHIQKTLSKFDSINSSYYCKNLENYLITLDSLDQWIRNEISKIPVEQRVLITAHDAFNYFGREYGFEVLGLQGLNTSAEAGIRDVQNLAGIIADRQIKAVFIETSLSHRNVEALKEAVKSRGFTVNIGGELFSDSLGDIEDETGTYIGMFKHNINVIVNALY